MEAHSPSAMCSTEERRFQINPLTALFVLNAFKRYDEGATMTEIRDWFNDQGVTNTRGEDMKYNSVEHLLKNRRYLGEFRYRDVIIPDGIPAIVPQDLFDRVQEKMAKNKKAPARQGRGRLSTHDETFLRLLRRISLW